MANYFRWKKGKRDEELLVSEKPRSQSLDPRSLELSGIGLVAQNYFLEQRNVQVMLRTLRVFILVIYLYNKRNNCHFPCHFHNKQENILQDPYKSFTLMTEFILCLRHKAMMASHLNTYMYFLKIKVIVYLSLNLYVSLKQ